MTFTNIVGLKVRVPTLQFAELVPVMWSECIATINSELCPTIS